jgi:4-alpha-methyl-delta7-sterol-4alpha-methyl oxidase
MPLVDAWLATYRDPLFLAFPVKSALIHLAAFALFAVPFTLIAWRDPERLRRFRIQTRRVPVELIVPPSLRWTLINFLSISILLVVAWPLLRLGRVHDGPLPPWHQIAWQLVLFIYLDDFLYYWMHRAFHHGWLYKRIHAVHHRIPTPWACGAYYMHPAEFAATVGLLLVGPLLVGAHVLTVWLWVAFRAWEAAEGHSGYAFPWNPSYLVPGYGGTEYHDFHHAKFVGNYAGFLGWLDRLFGSHSPGYTDYHRSHRPRAGG